MRRCPASHRVTAVSTWRAADGTLENAPMFRHCASARERTHRPPRSARHSGGAAFVDLVVISRRAASYAISRLDERSTDVALAYVSTINAPIASGHLGIPRFMERGPRQPANPHRFIAAVLGAVLTEDQTTIRDRLLLFVARGPLSPFLPGSVAESHDRSAGHRIRLARESVASDADAWRASLRARSSLKFAARGGDECRPWCACPAAVD